MIAKSICLVLADRLRCPERFAIFFLMIGRTLMNRFFLTLCAAGAALFVVSILIVETRAQEPAKQQTPQYVVHISLSQTRTDGKKKILAEPTVVVSEGRLITIPVGSEVLYEDKERSLLKPLKYGHQIALKLFRKDGKLTIDADATVSALKNQQADEVCITSTGLRIVKAVTLGKTIAVEGDSGNRWEITVEEATAKAKQ